MQRPQTTRDRTLIPAGGMPPQPRAPVAQTRRALLPHLNQLPTASRQPPQPPQPQLRPQASPAAAHFTVGQHAIKPRSNTSIAAPLRQRGAAASKNRGSVTGPVSLLSTAGATPPIPHPPLAAARPLLARAGGKAPIVARPSAVPSVAGQPTAPLTAAQQFAAAKARAERAVQGSRQPLPQPQPPPQPQPLPGPPNRPQSMLAPARPSTTAKRTAAAPAYHLQQQRQPHEVNKVSNKLAAAAAVTPAVRARATHPVIAESAAAAAAQKQPTSEQSPSHVSLSIHTSQDDDDADMDDQDELDADGMRVWSTSRWLAGVEDIDSQVERLCGPAPTHPAGRPHSDSTAGHVTASHPLSLFHPSVECEVVLMGDERTRMQCLLDRHWQLTPADALALAELDALDAAAGADSEGYTQGGALGDSPPASPLNLMPWLMCVMHREHGRVYGCWCGGLEWTPSSPQVRRHIRQAHGGVTEETEALDEVEHHDTNDEAYSGSVKQSGGAAQNVRVQLPPPALSRGLARSRYTHASI